MLVFDLIAEQKISAAIARGELADPPGAGRPLDLSSDLLVPEDIRVAYRLLSNAGLVPAELEWMREISALEGLADKLGSDPQRRLVLNKLQLLRLRRDESRRARAAATGAAGYLHKVLERPH